MSQGRIDHSIIKKYSKG